MQKTNRSIENNGVPETSNSAARGSQSNAIDIPSISLPKGGGAIKGIDEKFQVNPSNGTASFSIPLPLSPNRNGFTPALSVSYNSGAGNSILGIGWGLDIPSIQRKTDKRLPRYHDGGDDEDVFLFSGAEDLVPYLKEDGVQWVADTISENGYTVRRYRPRIEGLFARIERIEHALHGMYWRVTSRDNITTIFGRSGTCRIADPANPQRIFQWLPELSFDDKGSVVIFEYKAEDLVNVSDEIWETNRRNPDATPRFANQYLKKVKYGNHTPVFPYENRPLPYDPQTDQSINYFFELVLDYGEHDTENPDPNDAGQWLNRPDPYSDYRAGFEIRTHRLLRRALMFHNFDELNAGKATLVRSLDFQYLNSDSPDRERETELEFLEHIFQTSYVWDANNMRYRKRSLPPMTFEYEPLKWNHDVKTVSNEDLIHAPSGLSGGYHFTDLYNEGISGILSEQGNGWHYKHNLGDPDEDGLVTFSPAKLVAPKPSFSGLGSVLQLQDLDADGGKQIVVSSDGIQGYFELNEDNLWDNFRAFDHYVNVDLRDPNVRLLDLNGDGRPEILLTEENVFRWWPNKGRAGYETDERTFKPFDEEFGPAIVFSDPEQRIFLADMSGDGLTDIVRIRNGEVCYWPNLGYGHFGRKVTMGNAPWFDAQDIFNPAYLLLADISGTGVSDLIYLGQNRFRAWLNLSGNRWGQAETIEPFLPTALPRQITVTDLLGQGTGCLVWSSELPGDTQTPMRYMDLMSGKKPHIMTAYHNNMGKTVRMEYRSSTWYYLKDKQAGKPWITKLPFPVQVVYKNIVEDKWRNSRFVNTFSYHHGYYDNAEREFRGFGRVEQTDVEDFGKFAEGNSDSPYITGDKTLYQPPIKTVSWFHTGAFLNNERILNQFADEYFRPNGGDFYENELPEPDLDALGLSAVEYREALRACKGIALRTEVYELDVDALSQDEHRLVKFFSAAFHNCHIRCLQPSAGNPYAVFLATESEAITYHYELPLLNGQAIALADPRIAHSFNLRQDELGNPLETLAVAYPRWRDVALNDPLLPAGAEALIQSIQREMHLVYSENQMTNDIHTPLDYRLRVPCEVRTYELTGMIPANGRYFSLAELRAAQPSNWSVIPYQQLADRTTLQKRIVEQVRMLYFVDDLKTAMAFGQLNRLGLPYETYKIALTEDLLEAVLGDKLPTLQQPGETLSEMLERVLTEGGYHQFDEEPGHWWIRSGIAGFQPDAASHYYLPERYTDPFGEETTLTFDKYDLYITKSEDPLQNRLEVVSFDYRVLAPLEMKDPNGNLSEVAYDLLGIPAAMAVKGKGDEGDNLNGVLLDLDETAIRAFFTGEYNEAQALAWLGNATARHIYYLGDADHPTCAAGMLREKHVAQLAAGESSPIQIAFEYSDGGGAVIATKSIAEPGISGSPQRWITNGKTILNNKGNPVKQYEPYFIDHHRYSEPEEVGVTVVIYYDAAGRTVRTEMPDHTFNRVEFSPWHFRAFDANDTVLESPWFANNNGDPAWGEIDRNLPTSPNERAAYLAKIHANTSAETHTDCLGREVVAIAHNRFRRKQTDNSYAIVEEKYLSYTKLDAEGKPLWLQDARSNYVMVYARVQDPATDFQNMNAASGYVPSYDIAGNLLFQHSNEAGDRWMLPDITGQPLYVWDENEYAGVMEQRVMRSEYDALRRPTNQWLRVGNDVEKEIGRTVYGESLPSPETLNLRGQAVMVLGPEGRTEAVAFDFKVSLLEIRRQLLADATVHTMDWKGFDETNLSIEVFVQRTQYDALGRMTHLENWHLEGRTPAIYSPTYNRRGVLESETLSVRGQVMQAIRLIEYDAKGQRTRIQYGDKTGGVLTTTRYTYDTNTFRLLQLLTTSQNGTNILQDLHYTYDPVGNISEIRDDAYEPVFFRNQMVEPRSQYQYDALYRLIEARGRENFQANAAPKGFGKVEDMPIHNFSSTDKALRNYTQCYEYDPAGNFIVMQHFAKGENGSINESGSWTRHYESDQRSNRLLSTWLGNDRSKAVTYKYDTHGSMLNFTNVAAEQHNRWDYRDMIHTLDLEGGGRAYYQYDALKQRTRKRIEHNSGEYWERIYLGGYELYRHYVGGTLTEETETHHLFADEQRVLMAEEVRIPSARQKEGLLYRYQYGNHLGSVGLECDDTGQIISYEEYHPYGTTAYQAQNMQDIKAAAKRYRYTGMERDEESGLAYHTARYYLTWLGRWGSCDPIGVEGGGNLYEYCEGNSISFKDKFGNEPEVTYSEYSCDQIFGCTGKDSSSIYDDDSIHQREEIEHESTRLAIIKLQNDRLIYPLDTRISSAYIDSPEGIKTDPEIIFKIGNFWPSERKAVIYEANARRKKYDKKKASELAVLQVQREQQFIAYAESMKSTAMVVQPFIPGAAGRFLAAGFAVVNAGIAGKEFGDGNYISGSIHAVNAMFDIYGLSRSRSSPIRSAASSGGTSPAVGISAASGDIHLVLSETEPSGDEGRSSCERISYKCASNWKCIKDGFRPFICTLFIR
jgi:RHS repeat-associated protein